MMNVSAEMSDDEKVKDRGLDGDNRHGGYAQKAMIPNLLVTQHGISFHYDTIPNTNIIRVDGSRRLCLSSQACACVSVY